MIDVQDASRTKRVSAVERDIIQLVNRVQELDARDFAHDVSCDSFDRASWPTLAAALDTVTAWAHRVSERV